MNVVFFAILMGLLLASPVCSTAAEPGATTLSQPAAKFTLAEQHYVTLKASGVEAVIVDNSAVDDDVLPGHRAGYSGLASLKHAKQPQNLFVPAYAGLNFEHIHDGVARDREILFEPRHAPMELRVIDKHTVELYQAPSPHFGLESCQRFEMLPDGVIELTVECIPRRKSFQNGYVGMFWASYIQQPESLDIHFLGRKTGQSGPAQWIRGVTPKHGESATHLAVGDERTFTHDDDFPLSLVFNRSTYRYDEPWYFGLSHGMAYAQMFRSSDQIRFSQSPSGGGKGNPAWDFQWFVSPYQVGKLYRLQMRVAYLPFESSQQAADATESHRGELLMLGAEESQNGN
ncbi:MAG TPA: hypothetical protein VHC19_03415 [Pirellulales bacterium]|jgi:hypothetical protein|nr:hypothetical protein [Pirellulales bacterium]